MKTITIQLRNDPALETDSWIAWIDEGEFAKMLVAADSIGEAVKEIGISIEAMQKHRN